jgi:penicillin G amidase
MGFVPHNHRLQIIDPPSGYIVSANNRISSGNYYNGLHDYNIFTARSDRLHQIISEGIANGHKFTVEDMKEMLADTVDVYCQQILPYVKGVVSDASTLLATFDCDFVSTSSEAAMYEVFLF